MFLSLSLADHEQLNNQVTTPSPVEPAPKGGRKKRSKKKEKRKTSPDSEARRKEVGRILHLSYLCLECMGVSRQSWFTKVFIENKEKKYKCATEVSLKAYSSAYNIKQTCI
jgi:hypothetical protein